MAAERKRLDVLLTERGLFNSRSAARSTVMAGLVMVDGVKLDKPGTQVDADARVTVREMPRYVSRGGVKLEKALRAFEIDVAGKIVLDVGSSTGGFTDCLLQAGAERGYSVDVGYGQLDWRLRQDPRVVSLERTNIRYLSHRQIPEQVALASVDVSFISLTLVLPILKKFSIPEVVALVKPQFEVGKGRVGKKGVVREPRDHQAVLEKIAAAAEKEGYRSAGLTFSPLRGPEGNIEYLFYFRQDSGEQDASLPTYQTVVDEAHKHFG